MKKLTFGFMAFALAAATLFTSCSKDDDDDDNSVKSLASITATINGEKFSATAAASVDESNTGSKFSLNELLNESDTKTTIYGANSAKQFISVTFCGTEVGTYDLEAKVTTNPTQLLINYLSTGSIEDAAKESLKLETKCMIIYKATESAEDANSEDFYASTKAEVVVTGFNTIGNIKYMKGTFTATLTNKSNNTIEITDGAFSCPGK